MVEFSGRGFDSRHLHLSKADTIGLDEAIAVAQAYASTVSNTLVIVTADHETGGMSANLISGEDGPFYMPDGTSFYVNWTMGDHTGDNVLTTAQGPWSDLLVGAYENTHIHGVMRVALEPRKVYLPLVFKNR